MYYCCSHGTLLLNGFQSFIMNNCYYNQDLHQITLSTCTHMSLSRNYPRPPTQRKFINTLVELQPFALALSIFGAVSFGR